MVKCSSCGTAWTTSGLPICPVCGTRVDEPVAASTSTKDLMTATPYASSEGTGRQPLNGSAVLELPPGLRRPEPRAQVAVREVDPAPSPIRNVEAASAVDASAVVPLHVGAKLLPTPARPLNAPLILGLLAWVPTLLLPLTLAFEGSRVLGILGFCMSGFFAPFAPVAWMVGLGAEKRRRDQGLRAERRVSIGRLLGQGATLILITELSLALVGIAALRLSGSIPGTFWSTF